MSDKERAMQLLDSVPDDKADEAFCDGLVAEYEADNDKGNFISIDEMAEMSGVSLYEV